MEEKRKPCSGRLDVESGLTGTGTIQHYNQGTRSQQLLHQPDTGITCLTAVGTGASYRIRLRIARSNANYYSSEKGMVEFQRR